MTVTEVIIYAIILSLIEGFKNRRFSIEGFIKMFILSFVIGLIFFILGKLFLNALLHKYLDRYGIWIFGGFLLLYSIFITIKGYKNKN